MGPDDPHQAAAAESAGGRRQAGTGRLDVDDVLRRALAMGASDLHLAVEVVPTVRLNGRLVPLDVPPLSAGETAAACAQMGGEPAEAALRRRGEAEFSYSLAGVGRFRVSALRQRGSVALAVRAIPSVVPSAGELGLPPAVLEMVRRPSGLVILAGRSGSGRSTTLAALVDFLNGERNLHIVCLEDPIEYLHRHRRSIVIQREVGSDTPSWTEGLRSARRHDADVIVLGSLPPGELPELALAAAEAGCLVLAAADAGGSVAALERFTHGLPPGMRSHGRARLAAVLQGVVYQELLPRADGSGRVAAFEVLAATDEVRNLAREGKTRQIPPLIQTGALFGMQSLAAARRRLVQEGLVAPG